METITNFFATQGILGIIILMLLAVVMYLNKKREDDKKEITGLYQQLLTQANSFTSAFTEITKEMVAASKDNTSSNSLLQKSVETLTQIFQNFMQNKK